MFYVTIFLFSHCESLEDRHRGELACPHDLVFNTWPYDKQPTHISDVWVGVFTWWVSKTPWIRSRFWILKLMLSLLVFSLRAPEAHSDYLTCVDTLSVESPLCGHVHVRGHILVSWFILDKHMLPVFLHRWGNTDKQGQPSSLWGA